MYNNDLYSYADKRNITVDNLKLPQNKSMSVRLDGKNFIAIDKQSLADSADERAHLIHELGHCETGAFYCIYAPLLTREKLEEQANRWAVEKLIPQNEFLALLKSGYRKWELAEFYNVTEDFIEKAYHFYCEIEKMS